MKRLERPERTALVELFRNLSPRILPVQTPELEADLGVLVSAPLPRRPAAILFDVYGTLVVSSAGAEPNGPRTAAGDFQIWDLFETALNDEGFSKGGEEFVRLWTQNVVQAGRLAQTRTPHPEIDVEAVLSQLLPGLGFDRVRRLAVFHQAAVNPCAPMPGALGLLRRLDRGGLPLGLVSNAQFYTPILLEALFGLPLEALGLNSALTLFSFEFGVAKPGREFYDLAVQAVRRLGIPPEATLMVGNSVANDIVPARAAGFMTALFAGDARSFRPSYPGTPDGVPDTVLVHLSDLASLVQRKI